MIFLGDLHENFDFLEKLLAQETSEPVIQVGDLGLGFPDTIDLSTGQFFKRAPNRFPDNFYFICGNHDNPDVARDYPNYLGDYGYNEKLGLFYLSGAESSDKHLRIIGRDWWPEEELSYQQLLEAMDLYGKIKPKVVVSHDAPLSILPSAWVERRYLAPTRTQKALDIMWQEHQPEVWLFGHWHRNWENTIKGTRFICLKANQTIRLTLTTKVSL